MTQSSTAPLCSIYPSASFFCSKICLVFPILWEALAAGWDRGCCSEVCNVCGGGRGGEYVGMLFCKITHNCCLVPTIVFAQNFLTRVSWKSFEIANR